MRTHYPLLLALLLAQLFCSRAPAQQLLSLEQLRNLAADRATTVLVARQELALARLERRALAARLRPRLDLVANLPNYLRTSREVVLDDGTIGFRQIEINNSFAGLAATQRIAATNTLLRLESRLQRTDNLTADERSYQGSPVRLMIQQPLLAFNPLRWERELLPLREGLAAAELAAARADAALEATVLFFDLVTADQERRIAEANRAANEQLFAVAETRAELGRISRGDLVQLRLELVTAEQNLLRAERLLGAASAAIRRLTGQPPGSENYRPALPEPTAQATVRLNDALLRLRARRPELLAAHLRQREAARETQRTGRELGPRIDLEAGFGYIRNDAALPPIYNDPREERILSLNVSLPILDGGERRARLGQAAAARELADDLARRRERELTTELTQVLEQWTTVSDELRLAAEIRDLADERFGISRASYELGAIPLAELTLAQEFRDRNARAYVQSLRAYWVTHARLDRLTLDGFGDNLNL